MIILDVSFGIFAFLPQGWIFMAFVIISECIIVSRILAKSWGDYPGKAITKATIIANIVTYIVGSVLLYSCSFGLL